MRDTIASPPRGPLFIWAPLARCGITLLQRLVTSSREILVYGENLFLTGVFPTHMMECVRIHQNGDASRARMLEGNLNFWSSGAFPRMDSYQDALVRTFHELVRCYDNATRQDGFRRWGIKTPGLAPDGPPQVLKQLLPDAQHIFLYRHLGDVLCSYKARRWLRNPGDLEKAAQSWNQNLLKILRLEENASVMKLRYENLMANPGDEMERLRRFLGVASLDGEVLKHRVNTFPGEVRNGHSPDQYIAPERLLPQEWATASRIAAEALTAAGYPSGEDQSMALQNDTVKTGV